MELKNRPFWFGGAAENQYFTDREKDCRRLVANLSNGINTILISPRRWGKTSLVVKSAKMVESQNQHIKIVRMDIFSCRSPQEFCEMFAASIIKQTASKIEEWIEMGKRLLGRLMPVFSFGADPFNDFSIKFDFDRASHDIDEVLNMAERIAIEKGIHIVVCIDEFQQIGEFDADLSFQKLLRGAWQHQHNASYCLFGSKKHMMESLFAHPHYPFYKFGDIINLQRIPTEYWVPYIQQRFEESGKEINADLAAMICRIVDNNSSYVQQLSWHVWNATAKAATIESLAEGFNVLMSQCVALFEKQAESLAPVQYNLLLAMADGIKDGFSKEDIIKKYSLKNSASVRAAQKALEKKELLFKSGKEMAFTDPLLPYWLKLRSQPSLNPYELSYPLPDFPME